MKRESSWWIHLQEHLHCPKHAESALNADFLYKGQLPPALYFFFCHLTRVPATPVPSLSWTGQGWGMESIISRGLPTSHLRVPSHQLPASFQGHRRGKPMRTGTQHTEKKVHPANRSPHTVWHHCSRPFTSLLGDNQETFTLKDLVTSGFHIINIPSSK